MSSHHFFTVGGTLSSSANSYIERAADLALFEALRAHKFAYLLNARQMGKSSLSVRTMAKLRDLGVSCAMIDLTRVGGQNVTAVQWYATMARDIVAALGLQIDVRERFSDTSDSGAMSKFFELVSKDLLQALTGDVVLFFDEIDATQNLRFDTDEFFAGIRAVYNQRSVDPELSRLTFCLVGVAMPTDLISDPRVTPFNVGERIYLQDFSQGEIAIYADQLGSRGRGLIERLYHWTGGHPFLTQSLCSKLAADSSIQDSKGVDELVHREFLAPTARDSNTNLVDVARRILHSGLPGEEGDAERAEILSLYDRVRKKRVVRDDESNHAVALLKLSGLVRRDGGRLVVRNRIYERVFDGKWVQSNLPAQEQKRQRTAYLKGVLFAGGISTLTLLVIGSLAFWAILEARRADASTRRAIVAAQAEREARAESQEMGKVAYALAINDTAQQLARGEVERAMRSLSDLEGNPEAGWELDFLAEHIHRVGRTFRATKGRVTDMAYDTAGRLFALSDDGLLRIWDKRGSSVVREYKVPEGSLTLALDEKRDFALVCTEHGQVSRLDLKTGSIQWKTGSLVDPVYSISYCHASQLLWLGEFGKRDKCLAVSALDGRVVRNIGPPHTLVERVAASNDGTMVAMATIDNRAPFPQSLIVAEANTGKILWKVKGLRAASIAFSSDDKALFIGTATGQAAELDSGTGRILNSRPLGDTDVVLNAPTPDGTARVLAAGFRVAVTPERGPKPGAEQGVFGRIYRAALSPDGQVLATTGADGVVTLWNLSGGRLHPNLPNHSLVDVGAVIRKPRVDKGVYGLPDRLLAPDYRRAIQESLTHKGLVVATEVLSLPKGETLLSAPDHLGGVVSADGSKLAAFRFRRTEIESTSVFDLSARRKLFSLPTGWPLGFSPDGSKILIGTAPVKGGQARIILCDSRTGTVEMEAKHGTNALTTGAWSPNGRFAVVGGEQHTLALFDFQSRSFLGEFRGASQFIHQTIVTQESSHVVAASGDQVRIWEVGKPAPLATLGPASTVLPPFAVWVTELPKGRLLALWNGAGSVIDIASGRRLIDFPSGSRMLGSVLPDGTVVGLDTEGRYCRFAIEPRTARP